MSIGRFSSSMSMGSFGRFSGGNFNRGVTTGADLTAGIRRIETPEARPAATGSSSSDFNSILSRLQSRQQSAMSGYMSRLNANLAAQQRNQERTNNQRARAYGRVEREQRKQELDSQRSLLRSQAQVRDEQEDNALMLQRGILQNAQRRSYQSGLLTGSAKGTTNLSNRMS